MMPAGYRNKVNWSVVPTVILLISCTFAFFSSLYQPGVEWDLFLSSDALYLPSVYRDIFIDGNSISGWHLNPAPNFFPDMTFYFVLMLLTQSFIWSTFLFGLFQFLAVYYLFWLLFRQMFSTAVRRFQILFGLIFCLIAFEALYFTRDVGFAYLAFINAYHTGAFLMSLVCFWLSFKMVEEGNWRRLALICFLVFLTVFSDRLFIVLFSAPFCLTSLIFYIRRDRLFMIYTVTAIGLATFFGLYLFNTIDHNTYELMKEGKIPGWSEITAGFATFGKDLTTIMGHYSIKSLLLVLFVFSLALLLVLAIRTRKERSQVCRYSLYQIVFSIVVILAPVVSGKYQGYDCLRYNIFPLFMTGLNISVFFAAYDPVRGLRIPAPVPQIVVLIFIGLAIFRIDERGLNAYFNHYPPVVARIDSLSERFDLVQGVGNHWVSKKVTMFSKKNVRIRSVFDDLSIYDHVGNEQWFFNNIFTFVVLNNFSDTTLYRREIKEAEMVYSDGDLKLVKAAPFGYKRETGYRVVSLK